MAAGGRQGVEGERGLLTSIVRIRATTGSESRRWQPVPGATGRATTERGLGRVPLARRVSARVFAWGFPHHTSAHACPKPAPWSPGSDKTRRHCDTTTSNSNNPRVRPQLARPVRGHAAAQARQAGESICQRMSHTSVAG
ncbi:unnamed protein product, partial [Pleuronectes platessa]